MAVVYECGSEWEGAGAGSRQKSATLSVCTVTPMPAACAEPLPARPRCRLGLWSGCTGRSHRHAAACHVVSGCASCRAVPEVSYTATCHARVVHVVTATDGVLAANISMAQRYLPIRHAAKPANNQSPQRLLLISTYFLWLYPKVQLLF